MNRAADVAVQVATYEAAREVLSCLVSWGCIGRVVEFGRSLIVLGYARQS